VNREIVGRYAADARVLNCFSYTGGFTVAALRGGARQVTSIDSSGEALDLLRQAVALNGYGDDRSQTIDGDVFSELRILREAGEQFDLIILDPPKFIESKKDIDRGARGYKDINRLAFSLLSPGGILATFSCSGLMPADLFQKIVADGALDAGKEAVIRERLFQSPDHISHLHIPETLYLKGLVCEVV
jgi:23S rRNA (cytosine1962-C5)-methyltransferase